VPGVACGISRRRPPSSRCADGARSGPQARFEAVTLRNDPLTECDAVAESPSADGRQKNGDGGGPVSRKQAADETGSGVLVVQIKRLVPGSEGGSRPIAVVRCRTEKICQL
jgi:hypothetical protein